MKSALTFSKSLPAMLLIMLGSAQASIAQEKKKTTFPVKAFCIAAPAADSVERFLKFIESELAPRGVNTLVLRVDFRFQFKSHPELVDHDALTEDHAKAITNTCQEHQINLIPQVNLLGHQSWRSNLGKLLTVYPEFDETPHVPLPTNYKWPNDDDLYCKSYCPQHPQVHEVVFSCVDEVCDAFSADAFHAGMDEVFFIGDAKCERCRGMSKAKLFADEVNRIHGHLQQKQRQLWIWGDRLIDGTTTGIGQWEASTNETHAAIDLISKEVIICDWHYERADKTAVLFASKGFSVVTAVWNRPTIAAQQVADMAQFQRDSPWPMRPRYLGMMQTVWEGAGGFMSQLEQSKSLSDAEIEASDELSTVDCFKKLFAEIEELESAGSQ